MARIPIGALIVVALASALFALGAAAVAPDPRRVLERSITALTFNAGKLTTARRGDPVMQAVCSGGACAGHAPRTIQCTNTGWDGSATQWRCTAEWTAKGLRFGAIEIGCEGWDRAGDEYVLAGSCGLEYELIGMPSNADDVPVWEQGAMSPQRMQQVLADQAARERDAIAERIRVQAERANLERRQRALDTEHAAAEAARQQHLKTLAMRQEQALEAEAAIAQQLREQRLAEEQDDRQQRDADFQTAMDANELHQQHLHEQEQARRREALEKQRVAAEALEKEQQAKDFQRAAEHAEKLRLWRKEQQAKEEAEQWQIEQHNNNNNNNNNKGLQQPSKQEAEKLQVEQRNKEHRQREEARAARERDLQASDKHHRDAIESWNNILYSIVAMIVLAIIAWLIFLVARAILDCIYAAFSVHPVASPVAYGPAPAPVPGGSATTVHHVHHTAGAPAPTSTVVYHSEPVAVLVAGPPAPASMHYRGSAPTPEPEPASSSGSGWSWGATAGGGSNNTHTGYGSSKPSRGSGSDSGGGSSSSHTGFGSSKKSR